LHGVAHKWRSAINLAKRGDADRYHAVRIKTKTLRYLLELISRLLQVDIDTTIEWLKGVQDQLGEWHDAVE
jgi:CHAD domain-containing protein